MAETCTPGETLRILEKYGIRARKKYGQNFLIDGNVVRNIIAAADIGPDDTVLEIGPGIGSMTGLLAKSAGHVVCVEIDTSLEPVLKETLADCDNVEIVWGDVLKTDLKAIAERYGGKPLKVVANLPYYVTTPILMQLLEERGCFRSVTVMVQKEVAERICGEPGSDDYGAITLAVRYYGEPEIALTVAPSCFIPRPNVTSSVLHIEALPEPPVDAPYDLLFGVIRASFNQRRKTLVNGIMHGLVIGGKSAGVSRQQAEAALEKAGLPLNVRGETLSLGEFSEFAKALADTCGF